MITDSSPDIASHTHHAIPPGERPHDPARPQAHPPERPIVPACGRLPDISALPERETIGRPASGDPTHAKPNHEFSHPELGPPRYSPAKIQTKGAAGGALDKSLLRRRCDWGARCRQMTKSLSPNSGKRLEAYNLHKKYMILPLLLVLLFTAGLSLGQSANNTSIAENNSTATVNIVSPENGTVMTGESESNETILQNATQPGNVTSDENETVAAAATGLKFIWSVTGIEADQIIMVLDQDGTDLFGQAKYEPQTGNPWNGEVTGSVSGIKWI